MQHHYPVGGAQGAALKALGEKADNFDHANAIFKAYGLSVTAQRQGRRSVAAVCFVEQGGGFNAYGEGETWDLTSKHLSVEQLQALLPCFANYSAKACAEAEARIAWLEAHTKEQSA